MSNPFVAVTVTGAVLLTATARSAPLQAAFAALPQRIAEIAAEIDGRFVEPRKASAHDARTFVDVIEGATPVVTAKGVFTWEGRGITISGVARDGGETEVLQFTATNDNARVMTA